METNSNEVDQYISTFSPEVREIMVQIRAIIKDAAPDAVEMFAYKMPAYKTEGRPLVYFAGFNYPIGFYALPSGHEQFATELSNYQQGKGSVQFPLDKPIPYDLIKRIVEFRVKENSLRAKRKK